MQVVGRSKQAQLPSSATALFAGYEIVKIRQPDEAGNAREWYLSDLERKRVNVAWDAVLKHTEHLPTALQSADARFKVKGALTSWPTYVSCLQRLTEDPGIWLEQVRRQLADALQQGSGENRIQCAACHAPLSRDGCVDQIGHLHLIHSMCAYVMHIAKAELPHISKV